MTKSKRQSHISTPNPLDDITHQNILLLTHDLLYMIELTCTISEGDFGHVEDICEGNLRQHSEDSLLLYWTRKIAMEVQ